MSKKYSRIIILLLVFIFSKLNVESQNINQEIPVLTTKQMQEDFDYLIKVLTDVNPQVSFRTKLTGIDPIKTAKSLIQKEMSKVKNFEGFYYLTHKALCCMQDQHCKIYDVPDFLISQLIHIPKSSFEKTTMYINQFDRYNFGGLFSTKYINGKYYVISNYLGKNDSSDSTLLPAGSELIAMNEVSISKLISLNYSLIPSLKWDNKKKEFYSTTLFDPNEYGLGENIFLKVKLPNKDTVNIDFSNKKLSIDGNLNSDFTSFKVELFQNEILYIRIPEMNLDQYDTLQYLITKYKKINLSKVIIDIRNNPGGNDSLWIKLLGLLVAKPLKLNSTLLVKKTDFVGKYLDKYENTNFAKLKLFKHSLIPNDEEFVNLQDSSTLIKPNAESLNYTGKIYLLVNENCYSSSLAFLSAIRGHDKFVSVGQRTGWFGGRGITPFFFELPNSKIVFSVEPIIDFTGISDINQVLQDKPDEEIDLNIQDYINEISYKGERYSKDFLYNYDPTFRHVLNIH